MGFSRHRPRTPATRSKQNEFFHHHGRYLLKWFWKREDHNLQQPVLSLDERTVVEHFHSSHSRDHTGRYVTQLGESRSLAVRRVKALEHLLRGKSQFDALQWENILRWVTQNLYPHQNWKGPATRSITSQWMWSERSLAQQVKFMSSSMPPWRAHPEHRWTINYSSGPRSTHPLWTSQSCLNYEH